MNNQDISQILKLNKKFYQLIAKDFSKTRQKPWKGWGRVVDIIKDKRRGKLKILDIGCGNGRFFDFLSKNLDDFEYTGVDINNDLLNEARAEPRAQPVKVTKDLINEDIFTGPDKIPGKYDVISAFGVTHHIPDENFRKKWFSQIPNLLKQNQKELSLIAFSFWDFEKEPGDYLLGWGNRKGVTRYCHKYSDEELQSIIELYRGLGLNLIESYGSDNRNIYLIFGKI